MTKRKETDKLTIHKTEKVDLYRFNYVGLKDLAEYIEELRNQYGDDAVLEIDYSRGWYDSIDLEATLTWQRLETDEELAARLEKNREYRAKQRKRRQEEKKRKAAKELDDLASLVKKHPELAKKLVREDA